MQTVDNLNTTQNTPSVKIPYHAGRPLKYKSPEELENKVTEYFTSCYTKEYIKDKDGNVIDTKDVQTEPFTITGLALALDLSRESLLDYENGIKKESISDLDKQAFADIIKKAKSKVRAYVEKRLLTSANQTGAIFWLKNNDAYHDRQEQKIEHTGNISLTSLFERAKQIEPSDNELLTDEQTMLETTIIDVESKE